MKSVAVILRIVITMPIWFYLMHWMMVQLHAGDLQMFLFWVYVPVTIFSGAMIEMATKGKP